MTILNEKPLKELIEKIALECKEAGATQWNIAKIIKQLNKANTKNIEKLRNQAIEILKKINPEAAQVYSSFHKLKVFTSSDKILPFDRGNIIKSLLKETSIPRTVAESIGHEVENKIKDLNIKFLSASLIRELTNAKLTELNHEDIRNQYARIGMPVFDVQKKIIHSPVNSKEIMKEFTLLKVLPKEFIEMHFNKELIIPFLYDFALKFYSLKVFPEEKPILDIFKKYFLLQKFSSKPLCFNAINYAFASRNANKKAKEITEIFSVLKDNCFSLFLFDPDQKLFKGRKENAIKVAEKILMKTQEKMVVVTDDQFKLKLLGKKMLSNNISLMQARTANEAAIDKKTFSEKNVLLALYLNLNSIAFNTVEEEKFFEQLNFYINKIKELKRIKEDELKKRTYMNFKLDETQNILFLHSLFDASEFIKKENKKKSAEKIIRTLKKELPDFILFEAENHPVVYLMKENNKKKFDLNLGSERFSTEFLHENYNFFLKASTLKEAKRLLNEKHSLIELNEF